MSTPMTGKERILSALSCGQPDRVPIFELGINEASIVGLGRHFTDDVPEVKHVYDMTFAEQRRYMELLALILGELGNDGVSTVFIMSKERVEIIVGGAPLSAEFAEEIGADGFAADAYAAVKVGEGLLGV